MRNAGYSLQEMGGGRESRDPETSRPDAPNGDAKKRSGRFARDDEYGEIKTRTLKP